MADPQESKTVLVQGAGATVVGRGGCLVVMAGGPRGKRFPVFDGDSVTLGREESSTVPLDDASVSRVHARVAAVGGRVLVEDLGSSNGTFVNGQRLSPGPLELTSGDEIRLGKALVKFLWSGSTEEKYHEELYRQATQDPLTGTYNKRYLVETLERELGRVVRYERSLGLALFDIDHFKRINDTWGHVAGDVVLRELGALVRGVVRSVDVFARYGGEEFAIVMPDIDLAAALMAAERVRASVEAHVFNYDGARLPVTISLGVASSEPAARPSGVEAFVAAADAQLYAAKSAGRNRVR